MPLPTRALPSTEPKLQTFTTIIIIIITDRFYTAQFSALEQTHCAHAECHPERVTASDANLHSFRSPVSVLLLLGETPHVEVGLRRLGSQNVVRLVFMQCHRLRVAR